MKEVVRKAGKISLGLPGDDPWQAKLDLLMTLVCPDLEARYKESVCGCLWMLLNHLLQLLICTYGFSIDLKKVKLSLKGLSVHNLTSGSMALVMLVV